jgi:hypothetical protein
MEEGLHLGRRADLVGGGLVRSLGWWSEVKRKSGGPAMSDERILGESDFVDRILSEAGVLRSAFREMRNDKTI